MRVPVCLLAIPCLAGATLGVLLFESAPDRFAAASAAAAALAALAGVGFLLDEEPYGVVVAVVLGAACAGYASGHASAEDIYRPSLLVWFERSSPADETVVIEGVLREDAVAGAPMLSVDVRRITRQGEGAAQVRGGVRAFVGGAPDRSQVQQWRAGRTIRATALVRVPGTFANPGVADDRRLLARRGIVLTGTVKSASLVEVVHLGGAFAERAAAARAWVRRVLQRQVGSLDARSGAIATAILIGDRTGLSEEDERRLQDAGTYHVIAISGGNIAILTAVLLVVARTVAVPQRAAAGLSIAVLLFYGEIAGGAASVGRAITAAVLVLVALILDHRGSALTVLGVAALSAVALSPLAVLDAGFLLSFGATLGIIVGVRTLVRPHVDRVAGPLARQVRRLVLAAAGVLAATVCAEVALMPVAASLFMRITVAGLVLNLVAIPLMTLVQCGSMALLVAEALHVPGATSLAHVVHFAATGLVDSSRLVDLLPWLARDVAPPAWWLCAAYYGCAALAAASRWKGVPAAGLPLLTALLILGPRGTTRADVPPRPAPVLRVTVLDVGQGDAVLISAPGDAAQFLVDAGGLAGSSLDIGYRVLLPALRALRVGSLDALVLTHGDPDHIGGAEAVVRRLRPASVWEGVSVPPHQGLRRLAEVADADRVLWRTVRPGVVERSGGVTLRVLHPPEPDWERQRVRNDDSVVLEVRYHDVSILLPGDVGAGVERALLDRLDPGRVVILKAAHHGSATSSSEVFIDGVRPAAVIFSAGRHNRFGHPAPVVVERFARRGVEMFNTATDGAVFVETDGKRVEIRGWRSGRRVAIDK